MYLYCSYSKYITARIETIIHIGRSIMDESSLTKGQIRKLNALKKSIGDDLGEVTFLKWLKTQSKIKAPKADPVVDKLTAAMASLVNDNSVRLGTKGYTVKRARGKGAEGFIITKNT